MIRGWQYTQVTYVEESRLLRGSKLVLKMYDPAGKRPVPVQPQPENEIEFLNGLGRQGWELVAITDPPAKTAGGAGEPDPKAPTRTWYFKRPIPE
ncbi:hypothetical protein [Amycolatopsis kentuckyensis]|uniref:hypothetical protein n=1 Tax=Amycolatopsis kentuckyensis TaxID=218823 RepID=UPI00356A9C2F